MDVSVETLLSLPRDISDIVTEVIGTDMPHPGCPQYCSWYQVPQWPAL